MNEFSKLNRDQMKAITGGVPPACLIDNICTIWVAPTGHPILLLGVCTDNIDNGCHCRHDDDVAKNGDCIG